MELSKYPVAAQIDKECAELEQMVENHEKLIRKAVADKKASELSYAKAWLALIADASVKMTVEDRKQKVSESQNDLQFTAELSEEVSKYMAEAIRVKIEVLGAHRSILSSLRAEENNQQPNNPTPSFEDIDTDLVEGDLR